jgi:N-acetyl sugar amidotransferase
MDTSDPDISFDAAGLCNHCRQHTGIVPALQARARSGGLEQLASRIKEAGAGRDYDSVVGLSGGVDSSYVAYLAREMGLRPLAVHFDNGWNSELAVENIQRVVEGCRFDLQTYVINWTEFRDLQRAFLKASVIDIELLTDNAILGALVNLTVEHKIRFVLTGANKATELGIPSAWVWNKTDWRNIQAIHARFGSVPLRTFPHLSAARWLAIRGARRGMEMVEPLNLIEYRRSEAAATLAREFGWRDYGGKHYESIFTRFYQRHILPVKFGVDKRRMHLSSLIRNGELTRQEALARLEQPLYAPDELAMERDFVLKKLGFTDEEFEEIMSAPPIAHDAYASDGRWVDALRSLYRLAQRTRARAG